jgi:predicted FMN-binding regulatory protein PaiB
MKITRSYTLNEENIERLKKVSNASELIDTLLTNYFKEEESEESIRCKFLEAQRIADLTKEKLESKIGQRISIERLSKQKKMLTTEQETRRLEVEEMKRKWQNDEITDDEYWAFFDKK